MSETETWVRCLTCLCEWRKESSRRCPHCLAKDYEPVTPGDHRGGSRAVTLLEQVSEEIDRLLHDAQHAEGGASMAMMMGDKKYAAEGIAKRDRLIAEARTLHKDNPGARWPDPEDCEWPSVERP